MLKKMDKNGDRKIDDQEKDAFHDIYLKSWQNRDPESFARYFDENKDGKVDTKEYQQAKIILIAKMHRKKRGKRKGRNSAKHIEGDFPDRFQGIL